MTPKFIFNRTHVILTVAYFDTMRLSYKRTRLHLNGLAKEQALEMGLRPELISEAIVRWYEEQGYSSVKVENIDIRKWYQFYEDLIKYEDIIK